MLKDSTQKVLYYGLDNILKVEGKNINDSECSITVDKGRIMTTGNNRYQIKPETFEAVVVSFYRKGKMIVSEKFDVLRIPPGRPGDIQKIIK